LIAYFTDGVRVVDAVTGKPLGPHMATGVFQSSFSPDGTRVATSSFFAKSSRIWEAATGEPLTMPLEQPGDVWTAKFNAKGDKLATVAKEDAARVWDIGPCDWSIDRIERLAELSAGRRIDDSDAPVRLSGREWQQRWEGLRAEIPDFFRPSVAAAAANAPTTQR
jgi:hypothetical protein